jgi:hypothetical protein
LLECFLAVRFCGALAIEASGVHVYAIADPAPSPLAVIEELECGILFGKLSVGHAVTSFFRSQYGVLHFAQRIGFSSAFQTCEHTSHWHLIIFTVIVLVAMHRSVRHCAHLSMKIFQACSSAVLASFCTESITGSNLVLTFSCRFETRRTALHLMRSHRGRGLAARRSAEILVAGKVRHVYQMSAFQTLKADSPAGAHDLVGRFDSYR